MYSICQKEIQVNYHSITQSCLLYREKYWFCSLLVDHNPELYKQVSLITCSTLCTFFSILYWDSLNLLNKFLQKEIREGLSLISGWPLCHVNLIFKKKRDTTHRTTNAKRFGPRCFSKFNDSCIEFFSF